MRCISLLILFVMYSFCLTLYPFFSLIVIGTYKEQLQVDLDDIYIYDICSTLITVYTINYNFRINNVYNFNMI